MKKIFSIHAPNKTPARQVDGIKHEIKKYMARERRKDLPPDFDFWDFKCQMGASSSSAKEVHPSQVNATIDEFVGAGKEEFYLSLAAVPRKRQKKKD